MKFTIQKTYDITYSVKEIDDDDYLFNIGEKLSIQDAIQLHEYLKIQNPNTEYIIVVDVKTLDESK